MSGNDPHPLASNAILVVPIPADDGLEEPACELVLRGSRLAVLQSGYTEDGDGITTISIWNWRTGITILVGLICTTMEYD